MGRVAKYKKVKSFDPYSKKNNGQVDLSTVGVWGFGDSGRKVKKRSRRAEQLRQKNKKKRMNDKEYGGFDLPPTDTCGDDFDLSDIVGTVKKQKKVMIDNSEDGKVGKDAAAAASNNNNNDDNKKLSATKSTSATAAIEDDYVVDEKKVARILKLEQHDIEKKQKQNLENELYKRRDGESRNAYLKRTKKETRSIIQQTHQKQYNPEKRQRKKEFLSNKKKKQKKNGSYGGFETTNDGEGGRGGQWGAGGDNDDDDDVFEGGRNGNRYSRANDDDDTDRNGKDTMIVFGEQVERPPVFRQLPRGAAAKKQQQSRKAAAKNNSKKNDKNAKATMTEEEIDAESHAMDLVRRKIQAQYAAIKRSRRQHGDFHL